VRTATGIPSPPTGISRRSNGDMGGGQAGEAREATKRENSALSL
jgi:hypothetical protein